MSNTICMNAAPNGTFMNLPSAALVSETFHPRACIVGIPFDCGTHPFRVGSREGPSAIRAQSRLLRHYETGAKGSAANPTAYLRAVDAGDVTCLPGNIDASFPLIEQAIESILAFGAIPISMGGDGAVTLPQLRAAAKRYPDLTVIHIDAHTDTYELDGYNTATTFKI